VTELLREGRTILFVSHNLYAVEEMLWRPPGSTLRRGRIAYEGPIQQVCATISTRSTARCSRPHEQHEEMFAVARSRSVSGEGADGRVSSRPERHSDYFQVRLRMSRARPARFFTLDNGRSSLATSPRLAGHQRREPIELAGRGTVECESQLFHSLPRVYEIWGEVRVDSGWGNFIDWQSLGRSVKRVLGTTWLDEPQRDAGCSRRCSSPSATRRPGPCPDRHAGLQGGEVVNPDISVVVPVRDREVLSDCWPPWTTDSDHERFEVIIGRLIRDRTPGSRRFRTQPPRAAGERPGRRNVDSKLHPRSGLLLPI
jgi:hypothetical protein